MQPVSLKRAHSFESPADKKGAFDLHKAIDAQILEKVKEAIENKALLNACDDKGITPLNHAIDLNNFEIVALLLESGADPNQKDTHKYRPLHCAASIASLPIIQKLLGHGAKVQKRGIYDETCIFSCVNSNQPVDKKIECLKELIKAGSDLKDKDAGGSTTLHEACFGDNNSEELIEFLLENGLTIDETDNAGRTPLIDAAGTNCSDVVVFLLKRGANPNHQTYIGDTPLHAAQYNSNHDQVPIVLSLLNGGADPNLENNNGKTPLTLAASMGNWRSCMALIEHGATYSATFCTDNQLIYRAALQDKWNLVKEFASLGIKPCENTLDLALKLDDTSFSVMLLEIFGDCRDRKEFIQSRLSDCSISNRQIVVLLRFYPYAIASLSKLINNRLHSDLFYLHHLIFPLFNRSYTRAIEFSTIKKDLKTLGDFSMTTALRSDEIPLGILNEDVLIEIASNLIVFHKLRKYIHHFINHSNLLVSELRDIKSAFQTQVMNLPQDLLFASTVSKLKSEMDKEAREVIKLANRNLQRFVILNLATDLEPFLDVKPGPLNTLFVQAKLIGEFIKSKKLKSELFSEISAKLIANYR